MAQQANELDALASMLKLFSGGGNTITTSGGGNNFTDTKKTDLSEEAVAGLLKTALESNQGLAAVTQGQKAAGLFNSSTNRLLTNDLLARLTAQTATQGASTTTTRTATPQVQTTKQAGSDLLGKAMLGLTAYQKLGGTKLGKQAGSALESAGSSTMDAIGSFLGGGGSAADMSGFISQEAMNPMNAFADAAGFTGQSGGMDSLISSLAGSQDIMSGLTDFQFASPEMASAGADLAAPAADSVSSVDTAAIAEDTTNFPTASGTSSASSSSGSPSASEVLSEANATTVAGSLAGSMSSAGSGLGTAVDGISYGTSTPSSLGSLSTGGYDLGSGLTEAGGSSDVLAGSAGAGDAASSGGSILGYIGPVMSALSAENNPKGEQEKDYRHAVGSAVLNYFGWGWAAPIVHEVAEPLLNASMGAGYNSLGNFGVVMADPVGAPLSGQYDVGDLVTSTLDPANIFGGNEGGSSGALVAASLDPVGAMLGDTGANQFIRDTIDNNPISDAIGKVICTELAMQDKLPMNLYAVSTSAKYIMTGRVLAGYHVWGVSFVKALRKNEKLSTWIAPYVSAYIEHKSGIRPNWAGFWIKNIMHPICWCLSIFNRDKKAYLSLYRRPRKAIEIERTV